MSAILVKVSHFNHMFSDNNADVKPRERRNPCFYSHETGRLDWYGTCIAIIPLYWFKRYPYKHERDRQDLFYPTDLLAMEYFIAKQKPI